MQGSFYNLTQQWLSKHFFPPGPIHLTRTHVPTMPLYVSVGNFKLNYMESLKMKGFELFAAYGNTGTDVRAYEAAGIPKSRCGSASHSRLRSRFATILVQLVPVQRALTALLCDMIWRATERWRRLRWQLFRDLLVALF